MTEINSIKLKKDVADGGVLNTEIPRSENIDEELAKLGKNELKYLGRTELLEILLDYAKENEKLKENIEDLENKLDDKQIKINKFGSIAEASLELNNVFQAAEASCTQYLLNAKLICENQIEKSNKKMEEAEKQASKILAKAKNECENIEQEKAKLLKDTLLECERMRTETENECQSKLAAVNKQCDEKIAESQKQVSGNWEILSKRLEDFYQSHQGLMELINQGILPVPERGKLNEA